MEALNLTGRVEDYHQPYLDEWLVGLEKQFGHSAKLSFVYTRRRNHDMVALVDRNIATNYTKFTRVTARWDGTYFSSYLNLPLPHGLTVYLPNNLLLERLRCRAAGTCPDLIDIPGMAYADTANLTWNPDYVVGNAPDARREFGQFQMVVNVSRPTWGGSFSLVTTSLMGNLDNVTGYTDPSTYDPGPYVRINESIGDYGYLENYANRELKVSVWGQLPAGMSGGLFWTYRGGDHYSQVLRLTTLGRINYATGRVVKNPFYGIVWERLDKAFFRPLEGDRMYRGTRGQYQLPARSNVDGHLERTFGLRRRDLVVALDVFNVLGSKAVTRVQEMGNYGFNPWGFGAPGVAQDLYFRSPLERVPPRSFRLSAEVVF